MSEFEPLQNLVGPGSPRLGLRSPALVGLDLEAREVREEFQTPISRWVGRFSLEPILLARRAQ